MSSEIDSDEEAVKRARAANTLFQSFSSEEEDNANNVASSSRQREPSSRRNEKLLKLNSVRNKSKSKPRFLGDGLSDQEDNNNDNVNDVLERGIRKEKDRAHNRLFNEDDLANVSNNKSINNIPKRLDTSAIDRILTGGGSDNDDDENDIMKLGAGADGGEEGEDGITVVKKKRIVAKMNDERLIGPNGFPALQKEIMKFKTKGKGNETQDLKRLMSIYQLWCHQMYPKTNLRDTLQSVEKLCHKRSVHRALKGYREESRNFGKPPPAPVIIPEDDDEEMGNLPSDSNENANTKETEKGKSVSRSPSPPNPVQRPRFVVLPPSQASSSRMPSGTAKSDLDALFDDDDENEEGDLFAEVAEKEKEKEKEKMIIEEDDAFGDDDDLFAMIDETSLVARGVKPVEKKKETVREEEEFDEDADEIMRQMGMDF